jgi:hypothetical protein
MGAYVCWLRLSDHCPPKLRDLHWILQLSSSLVQCLVIAQVVPNASRTSTLDCSTAICRLPQGGQWTIFASSAHNVMMKSLQPADNGLRMCLVQCIIFAMRKRKPSPRPGVPYEYCLYIVYIV